ncbi:hypothetical protein T440DRAFT_473728 [Plenodomus tracheiphilus IPT5]|uniref:Uncharacterized protein n=1 Tax=Plenodomus tracheiphilus IPT5 TaxID=1408161 RepID=A0A6A7APK7_9PLEO|nr:hypothetical protein T440DRAFT_473728 [Plenodomus tracheiphilus IPT5]
MDELHRIFFRIFDEISTQQLKEATRCLRLRDVYIVLMDITSNERLPKLLEAIQPHDTCMAISMMDSNSRGKLLHWMETPYRLSVVASMPPAKVAETEVELDSWQEVELSQWPNRIADAYVMVGGKPMPAHYPRSMEKCFVCNEPYQDFHSAITADCIHHSFCSYCKEQRLVPDGCCLLCHYDECTATWTYAA